MPSIKKKIMTKAYEYIIATEDDMYIKQLIEECYKEGFTPLITQDYLMSLYPPIIAQALLINSYYRTLNNQYKETK